MKSTRQQQSTAEAHGACTHAHLGARWGPGTPRARLRPHLQVFWVRGKRKQPCCALPVPPWYLGARRLEPVAAITAWRKSEERQGPERLVREREQRGVVAVAAPQFGVVGLVHVALGRARRRWAHLDLGEPSLGVGAHAAACPTTAGSGTPHASIRRPWSGLSWRASWSGHG